ncbi:MAG: hypothetical protein MT490_01130 [Sphingomonas sp.]|uniref:hypothetical protein n=1 Tax=Sphingomonas sp. TaxID=28214 RepID=UPI002276CC05|nr:hypothetical protein [Sphingomonas sp.]MCX8474372.1 hypothetical protein [Sphingomonas sp.]
MDKEQLRQEVDANYDFFQRNLALLIPDHQDRYALLRKCRIDGFYDRPGDAFRAGIEKYPDELFSIQQVTTEVEDLGFFSRAGA